MISTITVIIGTLLWTIGTTSIVVNGVLWVTSTGKYKKKDKTESRIYNKRVKWFFLSLPVFALGNAILAFFFLKFPY